MRKDSNLLLRISIKESLMKQRSFTEILFIVATALVLTATPYLILSWQPQGKGRVINVAGYNLADTDPGVWVVGEGRPFSKETVGEIRVKQGEFITLRLASMDVVHGFTLPGYNLSEIIYPGDIVAVEFLAEESGEFEFYCSAQSCGLGHFEMKGTLIVEPE
jgi:heme/copper-type cytochrome/quinol oxidase subunit 2